MKNKTWVFSKRYQKRKQLLAENQRVIAARRKSWHGQLANQILSSGKRIQTEKLSYRAFQKNYGKSISQNAPGMLINILRYKAANAGGQVIEFSPYKTKLSQVCHGCGHTEKKSLAQRSHQCKCGVGPVQRDLYSAYLALHVDNDNLDRTQATKNWASADLLLQQALSRTKQTAIGSYYRACFGLAQRKSCLPVKEGSIAHDVKDVVRKKLLSESFEEWRHLAIRTSML